MTINSLAKHCAAPGAAGCVPRVSIIGAGRVGMTLGQLCCSTGAGSVADVLTRGGITAAAAQAFIGSGTAVTVYANLQPADIFFLTVPDDQIEAACGLLAASGVLTPSSVVVHCSGAHGAVLLACAAQAGAAVASIHPVRSFADPARVATSFAGTVCAIEGDPRARTTLGKLFAAFGARLIVVDPRHKTLYHAGAVFASNYLVTLIDVAIQTYGQAGISADDALSMIAPLLRETAENVFRLGPVAALTGPIARGDTATVARQQDALYAANPAHAALYAQLALATEALAARRTPAVKG